VEPTEGGTAVQPAAATTPEPDDQPNGNGLIGRMFGRK
jgi:hypothetical protein